MAEGFFALIPNLVIALVVFVALVFAARLCQSLIIRWTDDGESAHVGLVIGRLAKWALVFLGFMIAVSIVAPSVGAAEIFGMLGIGSVAIGFAFKDVLQNFLAGILILLHKPFRVGDAVKIAGYTGTVVEIETRSTILKTVDGQRVYIPNGTVFTSPVEVITAYPNRRHELSIAIAGSDDITENAAEIAEAMRSVNGVLRDPAPVVTVESLGASTVNLKAAWWTRNEDFSAVGSDVITAIKERLDPTESTGGESGQRQKSGARNDHKKRVSTTST
jgi:small-conductance mechanosensitive channel